MGTLQSNLVKIFQLVRQSRPAGPVLLGLCVFLGSFQNVSSRSFLYESVPPTFQTETTTVNSISTTESWQLRNTSNLTYPDHVQFKLNLWETTSDHKYIISQEPPVQNFRIAIHLKSCNFGHGEYITISSPTDGVHKRWHCPAKSITVTNKPSDFDDNHSPENADSSTDIEARDNTDNSVALEYVDNLLEVLIKPNWKTKNHNETEQERRKRSEQKAVIIINLYLDTPGKDNCPGGFFNCRQQTECSKCCSDMSTSKSGSTSKQETPLDVFTTSFWHKAGSESSRCIPDVLMCDGYTNCGMHNNMDENHQVCNPEKFCECEKVCLTLNYVLTSLAIAILFIITPTAIVFALFHRRNVALERARLIRLAQMRMAEMRGEYTGDDPNDRPPTYDEVYDIKVPPPCFCKAIAMQSEPDLGEQQNADSATNGAATSNERETHENRVIESQNLGFECSCINVSEESTERTEDVPPSYTHVNAQSDKVDGERSHIQSSSLDQVSGVDRDTVNPPIEVDVTEFENVDLDKDEHL